MCVKTLHLILFAQFGFYQRVRSDLTNVKLIEVVFVYLFKLQFWLYLSALWMSTYKTYNFSHIETMTDFYNPVTHTLKSQLNQNFFLLGDRRCDLRSNPDFPPNLFKCFHYYSFICQYFISLLCGRESPQILMAQLNR